MFGGGIMKYIIAALLLVLSFNVKAEDLTDDGCVLLSEFAEMIVNLRYAGMPLRDLVGMIENNDEVLLAITKDAYSLRYLHSEYNQEVQAQTYADDIYLMCVGAVEIGE